MNWADKIVMRPVASLIPYASNSRTHTAAQIELIAKSITAFGFTNPILVDGENGIVAGHARLAAANKLGLAQVPTINLGPRAGPPSAPRKRISPRLSGSEVEWRNQQLTTSPPWLRTS